MSPPLEARSFAALVCALGLAVSGGAALAAVAYAPPGEAVALKPGAGAELVQRNCVACHSLDYITTQPAKVAPGFWNAEVVKMVGVFGARIPDEDAAGIVAYLNAAYRG